MVEDDDWKRSALRDAAVVARVLSDLNHERLFDVIRATSFTRWGRKMPRSVPGATPPPSPKLVGLCDGGGALMKNMEDRPEQQGSRRSPTSPFSFDGFCSAAVSPTSGFEASSVPASRSKVEVSSALPETIQATGTNEATAATVGKKARKKKTAAELQEEESLLRKENMQLTNERNALRAEVEEQRALNQKLKRIKVDRNVQPVMRMACVQREDSVRTNHDHLASSIDPSSDDIPHLVPLKVENNVEKREKNALPFDLNMIPTE